jgi:hypothetical protein
MSDIGMLFIIAAEKKYRFQSEVGYLTIEDLYNLPLTGNKCNLNDIAVRIHRQINELEVEISFVEVKSSELSDLQNKKEIVLFIIDKKKREIEENKRKIDIKNQRDLLKSLISQKKQEKLSSMPIDDLEKMLKDLK